jgi:hypothetical protein
MIRVSPGKVERYPLAHKISARSLGGPLAKGGEDLRRVKQDLIHLGPENLFGCLEQDRFLSHENKS